MSLLIHSQKCLLRNQKYSIKKLSFLIIIGWRGTKTFHFFLSLSFSYTHTHTHAELFFFYFYAVSLSRETERKIVDRVNLHFKFHIFIPKLVFVVLFERANGAERKIVLYVRDSRACVGKALVFFLFWGKIVLLKAFLFTFH